MKSSLFFFLSLFAVVSCTTYSPTDYYNKAVSAGNSTLTLNALESRLQRLQSGMTLQPENISNSTQLNASFGENQLEKLEGLLGNEASDPMIRASIDLVKFGIEVAKNPKTLEVFEAAGTAATFEEANAALEPLGDYLDEIYNKEEAVYTAYDKEVNAYAKANNIEMKLYGPGAPTQN